nr:hypothetical protein [Tanacetum cinerariifolium]
MNQEEIQQAARDETLVPTAKRVKISSTNMRIDPTLTQKEETFQVIKKTTSYEFDLADKKCKVDVELFKKILGIYLRVPIEDFIVPSSEESLINFLYELGYKGQINKLARLSSGLNTIKDDGVIQRLKFVNKCKDFQEIRRAIPDTMLTDEIKQSEAYKAFITYSIGLISPKKTRGKSIRKTEAEIAKEESRLYETHECLVTVKPTCVDEYDESGGEAANGLTERRRPSGVAFRDNLNGLKDDSHQSDDEYVNEGDITWLSTDEEEKGNEDNDDKGIYIKETDDERADSDNEDQAMTDAYKNVAEKLEEKKAMKKRKQADDDQAQEDQVEDHADTKINSLLDVQIQQEIHPVLSAPLLDVLVSVIPPLTTTTTTPTPLITPLPTPPIIITTQPVTSPLPATKAPDAQSPLLETRTAVLQGVSTLEKDVKELKKFDHTTEYKQKDILFKMMMASKSYEKHLAHKKLYDALIHSLFMDEDDMDKAAAVADLSTKVKRKHDDQDKEPTTGSDQRMEMKKAKGQEKIINHQINILHPRNPLKLKPDDEAAPNTDDALKNNWFKQPSRPTTPDPEWNECQVIDDRLKQTWFNDMASTQKYPLTFSELMATPIDFFKFAKNQLKLDKITKEVLVGPTNPKGDKCLFDLSKPLPLKGRPVKILSVVRVKVHKQFSYGYLDEIVQKFFHLDGDVIIDLAVTLRMFTKRIVIQKRVKDVQLGVESYLKKLNIPNPQKDFLTISAKEPYTSSLDLSGVIYEDSNNQKRLMRADDLYKFLDGTLKLVRDILHHRL